MLPGMDFLKVKLTLPVKKLCLKLNILLQNKMITINAGKIFNLHQNIRNIDEAVRISKIYLTEQAQAMAHAQSATILEG